MATRTGAEPWDTKWAAEKAADALRYLRRNFPECLENLRALDEHEGAAGSRGRDARGPGRLSGGPQRLLQGRQRRGPSNTTGGGVNLNFPYHHALDRLLLKRFGGKVGRGLAPSCRAGVNFPDVWNLYLPRASRATLGKMNPQPKRRIMQGHRVPTRAHANGACPVVCRATLRTRQVGHPLVVTRSYPLRGIEHHGAKHSRGLGTTVPARIGASRNSQNASYGRRVNRP
jgi:hypothetical protein